MIDEDFAFDEGIRHEKKRQAEERHATLSLLGLGLICLAVAIAAYATTHRYKYYQECEREGSLVVEDTWTGKIERRFD